jgi:hypothetical protein
VLGGVNGGLHLQEPSVNRLYQTEPATFPVLLFWMFLRDSFFNWDDTPLFMEQQLALSSTVHEQDQSNRSCNIYNFVVWTFLRMLSLVILSRMAVPVFFVCLE